MREEQVFGERYRTLGIVGDGGMARVYQAIDDRLGRLVAVKTLHQQYADQPEFVARFEQEAQMAASLNHPNIVSIFDSGHDDDGPNYIVMEYVEGENLASLIQREGPLDVALVLPICRQLCAALDNAHDAHIVHRDIKPGNIFLTPDRHVKVGDFGIARALDVQGNTLTGTVLGSVSYFSPEQAQDKPATAQSDLYSTGVVLYEMLTRHLPFVADNALGVAMKHISEPPAPPSTYNSRLTPGIDAVVLKAIAKDPAQRYQSGAELIAALTAVSATPVVEALPVPIHRRTTAPMLPSTPSSGMPGGTHPWPSVTGQPVGGWRARRARPRTRRPRGLVPPVVALLLLGTLVGAFAMNNFSLLGVNLARPYGYVTAWATHQLNMEPSTSSASGRHATTNTSADVAPPATASTSSTASSVVAGNKTTEISLQNQPARQSLGAGIQGTFVFAHSIGTDFTPIDPTNHFTTSAALATAIARWTPAQSGKTAVFTWITPDGTHQSWSDPSRCRSEFTICYVQVPVLVAGTYHVRFSLGGTQIAAGQFTVSEAP